MKKVLSGLLAVLMLFVCPCTKCYAEDDDIDQFGGKENKIVYLEDGTKLTYVYGDAKIRQEYLDWLKRLKDNDKRNFSVLENIFIKLFSAEIGGLLVWSSLKIKNKFMLIASIIASAVCSGIAFFYPEYVRYQVDQVENGDMPVRVGADKEHGLLGMVNSIGYFISRRDIIPQDDARFDQWISQYDLALAREYGLIIVERPPYTWNPKINHDMANTEISGTYLQWGDACASHITENGHDLMDESGNFCFHHTPTNYYQNVRHDLETEIRFKHRRGLN